MDDAKSWMRRIAFRVPILGAKYRQLWSNSAEFHRINPGHYSSPVPSAEDVERELSATLSIEEDALPGIPLRTADQLALLQILRPFLTSHPFEEHAGTSTRYHLQNAWFQRTDGLVLHSLIHALRPKRIVEIGSGYSSFAILDTIERMAGPKPRVTLIEPNCERLLSRLKPGEESAVELIRANVQSAPRAPFDALEADAFLLVDSSHVSKAGSDVNFVVHEILPRLSPGVVVHFHDIFFPFVYPRRLFDRGDFWNEAYVLRAYLAENDRWELLFWNDYLKSRHGEAMTQAGLPPGDDIACSFWMRRR